MEPLEHIKELEDVLFKINHENHIRYADEWAVMCEVQSGVHKLRKIFERSEEVCHDTSGDSNIPDDSTTG